jgi:hypothetical protein
MIVGGSDERRQGRADQGKGWPRARQYLWMPEAYPQGRRTVGLNLPGQIDHDRFGGGAPPPNLSRWLTDIFSLARLALRADYVSARLIRS